MTDDADKIVAEYQELHRAVSSAFEPGGSEADWATVTLTKRQLAMILAAVDSTLEDCEDTPAEDPLTEDAAVTGARAKASLLRSLEAFAVSDDDKAVLLRMIEPAWAQWCMAMQTERRAGTDAYRMRAAALGLLVNVFWETVCMTSRVDQWTPHGERLLRQLTVAIHQGPGR